MEWLRRGIATLALALLLGAAGEASGQQGAAPVDPTLLEKIRKSNAECFSCHTQEGLEALTRADVDRDKARRFLMETEAFKASNHGGMECKTCHGQAVAQYPHAEAARATISPCSECHAVKVMKVEAQYHTSVHGASKLAEKFTCTSCHDPHLFTAVARLPGAKQAVFQDNQMCLECHASDAKFATLAPDRKRPDLDRIHDWLPNTRLHWEAVRCVDCHTPVVKAGLSHEIVKGEKAERNCVACHTQNSTLRLRLYRHAVKDEQAQLGFANAAILSQSYVIGATRHPWIDGAVIALAAATFGGVLAHGAIRLVVALRRRNSK